MKKNLLKKTMLIISLAVSAIAVTSVCTSCQGSDPVEGDDISVANIETPSESTENTENTETITTTESIVSTEETLTTSETAATDVSEPADSPIELMTTSTAMSVSGTHEITVPTGTQAAVTKPPVTEYATGFPEKTDVSTDGSGESESTTTTTTPSAGSYIGESPNSEFYHERLAIAGDSIAYGFNAYGFIPSEHNIATESVSMWNMDYFTFNTGMGLVDSVAYVNPSILYMSMGMNDVNMSTAEEFAERYKNTIYEIRNRVPDINIVVAGITPVTNESGFVSNQTIQEFNTALENMVSEMCSNHVYYFDAYSVVSDPATNELRQECTGGDGIHLVSSCYYDFLNALYNMLDDTPIKNNIETAEAGNVTQ